MNEQDIIQFYNTNSKEDTKAYLNQLIQNIKDITHTSYKHFIYLILIILVYYLIEESKLNSIGLGIIQISDIKIIKILIPPLFAINHLVVYLGMFRRQKLEFQTKELMNLIYQTPKQQKQLTRYSLNDFNLSYFPFYIFSEINYIIITNNILGFIAIVVNIILLLTLGVSLLTFNFLILMKLFCMWQDGFIVKFICIITSLIVLILISILSQLFFKSLKEKKCK